MRAPVPAKGSAGPAVASRSPPEHQVVGRSGVGRSVLATGAWRGEPSHPAHDPEADVSGGRVVTGLGGMGRTVVGATVVAAEVGAAGRVGAGALAVVGGATTGTVLTVVVDPVRGAACRVEWPHPDPSARSRPAAPTQPRAESGLAADLPLENPCVLGLTKC